jgi:hypothetical protein
MELTDSVTGYTLRFTFRVASASVGVGSVSGVPAGIVTGYKARDQRTGFDFPTWVQYFSSPQHPDRLWGPSSLLFH